MAEAGQRFPLLIYEHTLKRWYPATFALSIMLFVFWWFLPSIQPEKTGSDWLDTLLLISAGAALLLTVFIYATRKSAYVRAYPKYLRLATPFFRINISYKRFLKTTTAEMQVLFPPSTLSGWLREQMAPLMIKTAIVIDLKDFPLPLPVLRLFLSPFFFKDKTPHFVILVDKWMRFSTEMESYRSGGGVIDNSRRDSRNALLASLLDEE